MDRRKVINLSSLTRSHCEEIDRMIAGIRGNPDNPLWTAEMRAATRGGKCALAAPFLAENTD